MSSSCGNEESGTATSADAFLGTWRYPRPDLDGGMAYIHFTEDGRAIDSYKPIPHRPEVHRPWRLWYQLDPPSWITFRYKAERPLDPHKEIIWEYQFDQHGTLFLHGNELVLHLTRPEEGSTADWFPKILAEGLLPPRNRESAKQNS